MEETIQNFLAQPYSTFAIVFALLFLVGLFIGVRLIFLLILLIIGSVVSYTIINFGSNYWVMGLTWLCALWFSYLFVHRLTHWK